MKTDKAVLTKRARREAKKLFTKQAHSTRPLNQDDYLALPKGDK